MAVKYKRRYGGYGPLKAKRPKKRYKSVDNYLGSVWRNNKEYLEKHVKALGTKSQKQTFIEAVKNKIGKINPDTGKKYTIKQAIEKVQRSTLVTTQQERIAEVHLSRMRESDPEKFKELRKAIGWTNKIKSENFTEMTHDGNKNYLRYKDPNTGRDIVLVETISPKTGVATSYDIIEYEEWRYRYVKEHSIESPEMYALWQQLKNTKK